MVVMWLREQGCVWNEWVSAEAALGGHLEVLKWLREQGCPWNAKVCAQAAKGGHLEVLKWLREQDCPWDQETITEASDFPEIKKWALDNGCPSQPAAVVRRGREHEMSKLPRIPRRLPQEEPTRALGIWNW